ncbi:MAG: hypothetical protein CSA74_11515 [Rhodobacterales bacterium]|nr:MAG: hypothetical protein CSA74_11515 [Rhodobacterales bacterium]
MVVVVVPVVGSVAATEAAVAGRCGLHVTQSAGKPRALLVSVPQDHLEQPVLADVLQHLYRNDAAATEVVDDAPVIRRNVQIEIKRTAGKLQVALFHGPVEPERGEGGFCLCGAVGCHQRSRDNKTPEESLHSVTHVYTSWYSYLLLNTDKPLCQPADFLVCY